MKRLAGKVALISGCRSGIGAATARRFAQEGAKVALADIDQSGAELVAASIRSAGGDAAAFHLDLAEEASIVALRDATLKRFGKLDILHNNAADTRAETMARDDAVDQMETEVWDMVFRINARGAMLMIRHCLPALIASGSAAIINTSSGAALLGDLYRTAYAASKSAVDTLTKYVATQYGKRGVRCNSIAPGFVITENTRSKHTKSFDMHLRNHLTPQLGAPEDIAAMAALLASDEGRFITGQIIVVDGGVSTHMPHVAETRGMFEEHRASRQPKV
jgi:NAD(P)-dependent dehydrogenase (short-subunit alcohol dehydrogenase family)